MRNEQFTRDSFLIPRSSFLSLLGNPLAAKELRARMRGARPFIVATVYLAPLCALAVALYGVVAASTTGSVATGTPVGKLYFATVSGFELALICLLAPALTADLISGERERRTYDLLLVTPLSSGQIVVGKLVAGLGSLLVLLILALPLQAIGIVLGGVGLEELGVAFAILVLTALTYGCVGLFWSTRLRTTRSAMAMAYGMTALGILGQPAVLFLGLLLVQIFGLPASLLGQAFVSGGTLASPLEAQLAAAAGQLMAATNPLLTGVFTAFVLAQGRGPVFVERLGGQDVTYISPWLLFALVHLLASGVLIGLTRRGVRNEE
ncbi:MAG TPA: ABC transporter permease subunit [Chloroflexota bacterium]|nr:ABC transporter permease subunit [Chloroflexota bacterium]